MFLAEHTLRLFGLVTDTQWWPHYVLLVTGDEQRTNAPAFLPQDIQPFPFILLSVDVVIVLLLLPAHRQSVVNCRPSPQWAG